VKNPRLQGMVASDAEHEVRRIRRYTVDLRGNVVGCRTVHCNQGSALVFGQKFAYMRNDVRPAKGVPAIVETESPSRTM
jgi:hypothetical protein